MSEILTNNKYYKDIADTIRQMKGVATTYKPREMAGALREMYSTEVEGVPPLTFPSNGNNLLNYRIDGANGGVGDRTKNLWNEDYTDIPVNIPIYKPLYLGEGTFTLSTSAPRNSNNAANLFLMSGNVTQGASTNTTGCWNGHPITAIANNGYVTIAFRSQYNVNPADYQSQLEEGSTATDYEPYGYKIPAIISGKNLANSNEMIQGYWAYANGDFVRTNTWICTPKIPCSGNTPYTYQFSNVSRWSGFVFYDENGRYISTSNVQNDSSTEYRTYTATSPSNARCLVVNIAGFPQSTDTISVSDLINFQLEEGSTPTNYEPYIEPTTTNIYLDEAIEENESKSLSDTNVNIPTINGTNILSIGTTVQPNKVYVQAPKTNNYNL